MIFPRFHSSDERQGKRICRKNAESCSLALLPPPFIYYYKWNRSKHCFVFNKSDFIKRWRGFFELQDVYKVAALNEFWISPQWLNKIEITTQYHCVVFFNECFGKGKTNMGEFFNYAQICILLQTWVGSCRVAISWGADSTATLTTACMTCYTNELNFISTMRDSIRRMEFILDAVLPFKSIKVG